MSQDKTLALLVAIISLIALFSFFVSPFFELRSINVDGLVNLTPQEIKNSISFIKNKNIWLIDKDTVKSSLLKNNYIKSAEVFKKYPDSMSIKVKERIPLGKINNNGKYLVFDKNGFILEEGAMKTKIEIPQIRGVAYTFKGNKILFSSQFEKIVQALSIIDTSSREKIDNIQIKKNNMLNLSLKSKVVVYMGELNQLQNKFEILESTIHKLEDQNLKAKYLDLKIIKKPVIKLKN